MAGVGTALITAIGILYFREAASALKFISIALIIVGAVGLGPGAAKQQADTMARAGLGDCSPRGPAVASTRYLTRRGGLQCR